MKTDGLSINLATVRQQFGLKDGVEALRQARRRGDLAVARACPGDRARRGRAHHQAQRHEGDRLLPRRPVSARPMRRGGRPRSTTTSAMIDEAAAIGADCLVMIGGGLPQGSRDIKAAREHVRRRHGGDPAACARREGAARDRAAASDVLRRTAAASRCSREALDLCDALGEGVGVAIDAYHLWWDPDLAAPDRARRQAHPRRITSATGWCRRRTCCSTAA